MKNQVIIFGRKIPVIYKKDLLKNQHLYGYYDYDKLEICIDSNLTPKVKFETLLHECGHALFHRAGLIQSKMSKDLEEVIVEQFSIMFAENFK